MSLSYSSDLAAERPRAIEDRSSRRRPFALDALTRVPRPWRGMSLPGSCRRSRVPCGA